MEDVQKVNEGIETYLICTRRCAIMMA